MTRLLARIIDDISSRGAITFRDFMARALYDADHGYYCTATEKIGAQGDYYTAANISEVFGALIAQECLTLTHAVNNKSADKVTIVELGAGTGQLAADIIHALMSEHQLATTEIEYLICDPSAALAARQREKLAPFNICVRWCDYAQLAAQPVAGVIIANEVADALPVHRVRWQQGELYEMYVDTDGEKLFARWLAPATPALADYLRRLNINLIDGQIAEIRLDAVRWLEQLSQLLTRGYLIIIDYGDLADHLYAPDHFAGTLRCFYQHTLNDDPFARVGAQDITADTDFSALIEYGRDYGFEFVRLARQADFLIRLGLLDRLQQLVARGENDFASLKARLALKNFFVPGGISDHFKVLVMKK